MDDMDFPSLFGAAENAAGRHARHRAVNAALSIALPTYNRAPFLDAALTRLIATVAPHDIRILVSDNASTDDTAPVVQRHAASYPLLDYVCNAENLGPDGNFEAVLRQTSTRYVWLLGDTYEIELEALQAVLAAAEAESAFDAIAVDVEQRAQHIPEQVYTDRDALLADLGWHMTCMSALILSRDLVEAGAFERYRDTSFIHVGVVFDYIARRTPSVLWLNRGGVKSLRVVGQKKVSVWEEQIFRIWVDRWVGFVLSLPAIYKLDAKFACAGRHARSSALFSLAGMVKLRASGILDIAAVTQRWTALRLATGQGRFLLLACALVPAPLARLAVQIRTRRP
jgi:glycosyltransferase involved in cell wall biosynthesis